MNKFWKQSLFVLTLLMTISACTGLAGEPEIVATLPVQPTAIPETFDRVVNLDTGAIIFAENCVRCHGITGAGNGELVLSGQIKDVPDFTDPATIADVTLQEWFDVITNGRLDKLMPPWKDSLSRQDRWAVALYTYSMSYTVDSIAQGEAIYTAQCLDCHAEDGSGIEDGTALQGLVNFSEVSLRETVSAHQADLALDPPVTDENLGAVVQFLRLLSAETQALPDPNAIVAEPQPASTEDVAENVTESQSDEIPQAIGILRGQIIQGTEGGSSVEGLEAVIHIYDSQLQEQIGEYIVDADGTYQYDDVVIRPDFAYRMTAEYNGITFASPVMIGDPENTDMELNVKIYESGATEEDLVITSRATQANLSAQGLYIIEVVDMLNTSDRVYMREIVDGVSEPVSVGFALPEGAQLQLDHTDPNRIGLSTDGRAILDYAPVLPDSEHYVQYSYLLPIENASNINQPIDYNVAGPIGFFVENSHLSFTSAQTEFNETRAFNGQDYDVYLVSETPSIGDVITYSLGISENPAVSASESQAIPREVMAVILVVGGIVLLGGAGIIIWRGQRSSQGSDNPSLDDVMRLMPEFENLFEKYGSVDRYPNITQEDLIKRIAQIDEAYEAGELTKENYEKQRNFLKSLLMQLMKKQEN